VSLSSLTRRELEVLRLLVAGLNNTQIAEHLTIGRVHRQFLSPYHL